MPNIPKTYTARGESLTLKQWAARNGIPAKTIHARLRDGWSVEDAVGTPSDRRFRPKAKPVQGPTRPCPTLRTHRPTGRAFCDWQAAGTRHVKYFGKAGSEEAAQAYARFQLEWASRLVQKSAVQPGTSLRVCNLVEQWLDYCENGDDGEGGYRKRGKLTSAIRAMRGAMQYVLTAHGTLPVNEFGPDQLRAVRKGMIDAELLRKTINGYQSSIVQMFGWGVGRKLVPATVWHELKAVGRLVRGKTVAKDNPKKTSVPWPNVEAIFPHLHRTAAYRALLESLIRFHWLVGGRPEDIVGMRLGDLDRSEETWRYVPDTHKNEHREQELEYWIGPKAQAILAPLLEGKSATALVFTYPGTEGREPSPVRRGVYARRVSDACKRAKVKHWTPHQLRHSRATEVMRIYESSAAAAAAIGDTEEVARTIYVDPLSAVRKRIARETG